MKSENENAPRDDEQRQLPERRSVIKKIGGTVFTFSVIGVFGAGSGAQQANQEVRGGTIAHCLHDDEGSGCAQEDQSCGGGQEDQSCELVPGASSETAQHSPDENCGSGDQDNACGDCNDDHDTDQNCGTGSGQDTDELCGHAHYATGAEDQACSATNADAGCGDHNTTYNVDTFNDTDEHCDQNLTPGTTADSDQNCAGQVADATCGVHTPAYSTSPDEMCSSTEYDGACGPGGSLNSDPAYDRDESCNGSAAAGSVDESCGAGGWLDGDEACSPPTDPDNNA